MGVSGGYFLLINKWCYKQSTFTYNLDPTRNLQLKFVAQFECECNIDPDSLSLSSKTIDGHQSFDLLIICNCKTPLLLTYLCGARACVWKREREREKEREREREREREEGERERKRPFAYRYLMAIYLFRWKTENDDWQRILIVRGSQSGKRQCRDGWALPSTRRRRLPNCDKKVLKFAPITFFAFSDHHSSSPHIISLFQFVSEISRACRERHFD